jgi:two-component system, NtrC family, sensor kinase
LGFIILFRDVSQKKEIQKKLNEAKAQVIQSEKLAGIGQLAAGIAHEINNPLGYINSNLNTFEMYITNRKKIIAVYKNTNNPREIGEAMESLKIDYICNDIDSLLKANRDGIQRISEIVKNLKDFARVNPKAEWESADLNGIINNVLLILRNEIKYYAESELKLSPDIPHIFCNVGEVNQVFLNIIINAVHAIKKKFGQGQGKIRIETFSENNRVACKIEDNGCGIPEDIRARIFEPFFTTKEPGEGTGLGLHIAYDIIVKKHRGEISVQSTEGKGTVFTLVFELNRK